MNLNTYGNSNEDYDRTGKNKFDIIDEGDLTLSEYESFLKNIESIINEWFLRKEYYENQPDGQNLEIANICNYSARDIEQRIKDNKGVFYMNPCLSQTLYSINKLKKVFPNLSKKTKLCIEMLKLPDLNISNIHAYILIDVINNEPIIIDYARNNDVYIYQGDYLNRSSQKVETETTYKIPAYSFDENDNIFGIIKKSGILKGQDIDFKEMIKSLVNQLTSDNSEFNYRNRKEKNPNINVYNLVKSES